MNETKIDAIYIVRVSATDDLTIADRVGWYDNEKDALEAVKTNTCDIWETCYNYAVVEKVEQGMFPTCKKMWIFKYRVPVEGNPLDGEYELIEVVTDIMKINKLHCTFVG